MMRYYPGLTKRRRCPKCARLIVLCPTLEQWSYQEHVRRCLHQLMLPGLEPKAKE